MLWLKYFPSSRGFEAVRHGCRKKKYINIKAIKQAAKILQSMDQHRAGLYNRDRDKDKDKAARFTNNYLR